jgi:ATP-dependent helicase/nuclease subunit A
LDSKPYASPFTIYRSSAGSGKTYQLALEYVSLVVSNPNNFNKILAVTFTNKATREMKDRILDFLRVLADRRDDTLQGQIALKTRLRADEVAKNAALVNEKILHNYSEFSISTIDSFFQKIVKSFAKELGLLGNYKVELDQEKVMNEVIDHMIGDLGKDKQLTRWLLDFSFSKVDESKVWNIRPQIESLAGEVLKESYHTVESEIANAEPKQLRWLQKLVDDIIGNFESQMTTQASLAMQLIANHELSIQDFAYGHGGPAGYFQGIIKKREFKPKKRLLQAIEDRERWFTKNSDRKDAILGLLNNGLYDVTQQMADFCHKKIAAYNTARAIKQNMYVFGVLSRINQKLKEYRLQHDAMLISDVAVFLNKIIDENEAPFIYEKAGSWYMHYLIDEFQDTSGHQWANFRPLLESGISEQKASMIVGDGKQSIYRWRGGDWRLILQKAGNDLAKYRPAQKNLDTNWRSAANIISFNNVIFFQSKTLVASELKDQIEAQDLSVEVKGHLLSVTNDIDELYQDATQKPGISNERHGSIEINAYQKEGGGQWKTRALEELPRVIEKLQDQGVHARDIAILVRKSDDGKKVIEKLLRQKASPDSKDCYCYAAVSNESLFLNNSSAIRLIVNAMQLALNPGNELAMAELKLNHYLIQNGNVVLNDLSFMRKANDRNAEIIEKLRSIVSLPAYEMVEQIIETFGITNGAFKGYIQAFQDLVLEHFESGDSDLSDFIDWWHEKGKQKSVQLPSDLNAIRIMTIHKSKGLEFKAVIIPFCEWKLDHELTKDNYLWCKTDQRPFEQTGYLPLKYSNLLGESYFAKEYYEEKMKAYIDNLNLLYVALTRARSHLVINCPPPSSGLTHVGDLLLAAMKGFSPENAAGPEISVDTESEAIITHRIGEVLRKSDEQKPIASARPSEPYQTSDWRKKIAIRKKGGLYFSKDARDRASRINHGILVHEILASIRNVEEAEAATDRLHLEGIIDQRGRHTLNVQLKQIFSNPLVQRWFNTGAQVKPEMPILMPGGQWKQPDRVIITGNEAVIIDFKTGKEKHSDLTQIREYGTLFRKMGFRQVKGYLLYIPINKIVQVL